MFPQNSEEKNWQNRTLWRCYYVSVTHIKLTNFFIIARAEPFLILEVAKPFCTTLLLISVLTFVKAHAPLTTMATMEAIFGSSYFGVGRGLGGLFGGLSIEAFGDVTSFRYVCCI